MRWLGVSQWYAFAKGWVEHISNEPWEFALFCERLELFDTKIEVMVL